MWSTTAESQIMVLHLSSTGNCLTKIGIVAFIIILEPYFLRSSNVFCGIEHLHTLTHGLKSVVPLVRDLKSPTRSFLGLYLYDARGATRSIKSRFTGILQHRKTFNISRINSSKRSHIRCHPIDNNQRIVAAHDRRGATHTHRVEHGHSVKSIACHVHTCRLSVQGIECIIDHTLFEQFRLNNIHCSRQMQCVQHERLFALSLYCQRSRQRQGTNHSTYKFPLMLHILFRLKICCKNIKKMRTT